MAFSKPLVVMALFLVALLMVVDAQHDLDHLSVSGGSKRSLLQATTIVADCPSACEARCANNWKNKMCNRMCNICCGKCNCVPPGTGQDTRNLCPCYANMVDSKNGKLKCP